jgi:hypothetical protein
MPRTTVGRPNSRSERDTYSGPMGGQLGHGGCSSAPACGYARATNSVFVNRRVIWKQIEIGRSRVSATLRRAARSLLGTRTLRNSGWPDITNVSGCAVCCAARRERRTAGREHEAHQHGGEAPYSRRGTQPRARHGSKGRCGQRNDDTRQRGSHRPRETEDAKRLACVLAPVDEGQCRPAVNPCP